MTAALRRHWPAAAILLYFLLRASYGLHCGFSYDDATNLYLAWTKPLGRLFTELHDRPLGGLFYRAVYAAAGFHPFPFHLACLALLAVNLILLYRVLLGLAGARDLAWAALLFGCYQGTMWDIYTGVAMVYDILCGTLYVAALLVYFGSPRPRILRALAVAALTALALGAKEMALSLPIVLLLYELLLQPRRPIRDYVIRIGPAALVCAVFAAGRLWLPGPLTGHPAYTPVFTVSRLLETTTAYTRQLFSGAIPFTPALAVAFWLLAIALAVVARSRLMLFGVLSFLAGMAPMAFVTPRTMGYPFYVPFFGLALYAGAGFILLRDRLAARRPALAWAAFLSAVVALHAWQAAPLIRIQAGPGGHVEIREMLDQVPRLRPTLPSGATVLLIDSPFRDERWVPMFVMALIYNAPKLTVVNARAQPERATGRFDYILVYKAGTWSVSSSHTLQTD